MFQSEGGVTDATTELLTVSEAAELLRVPVSWIYEHVRPEAHARIPFVKLGKYLRFDPRDLQAYVDANRYNTGEAKPSTASRKKGS